MKRDMEIYMELAKGALPRAGEEEAKGPKENESTKAKETARPGHQLELKGQSADPTSEEHGKARCSEPSTRRASELLPRGGQPIPPPHSSAHVFIMPFARIPGSNAAPVPCTWY